MGKRIRAHVNPFKHPVSIDRGDWAQKHQSHDGAICLDMGCAKGEFVAALAQNHSDKFYIGVEIRKSVADEYFEAFSAQTNLALLYGNINFSLESMFQPDEVSEFYLNFPDPYTKKVRLKKRRTVNSRLVEDMFRVAKPGARVFFQTDARELFYDSHELLSNRFQCATNPDNPERVPNKTGAVSDWERKRIDRGIPIYRSNYAKAEKGKQKKVERAKQEQAI